MIERGSGLARQRYPSLPPPKSFVALELVGEGGGGTFFSARKGLPPWGVGRSNQPYRRQAWERRAAPHANLKQDGSVAK
jgi:hypothetical protein